MTDPRANRLVPQNQKLSIHQRAEITKCGQFDARLFLILQGGAPVLLQHPGRQRAVRAVRQSDDDIGRRRPRNVSYKGHFLTAQRMMTVPDLPTDRFMSSA